MMTMFAARASELEMFFPGVAFLFGLALGSFLNVCIYRMPRELSVVSPRSACPRCKAMVRWHDNIPVLSWIILRGRCRDCHAPISPRYAVVELLTAALFALCVLVFGPTLAAFKFAVLSFLLLGLIFTDLDARILPDQLTLSGIALGLVFSLLVPLRDLLSMFVRSQVWIAQGSGLERWISLGDSIVGALVGAGFIYGVGALYLSARGVEGMGFGDVKLMAMVGAFLGIRLTLFTIFAAALTGSVFGVVTMLYVWMKRMRRRMARHHESAVLARRRAWKSAMIVYRNYQMPFGVYLGSMAILALFRGEAVVRWYGDRFL